MKPLFMSRAYYLIITLLIIVGGAHAARPAKEAPFRVTEVSPTDPISVADLAKITSEGIRVRFSSPVVRPAKIGSSQTPGAILLAQPDARGRWVDERTYVLEIPPWLLQPGRKVEWQAPADLKDTSGRFVSGDLKFSFSLPGLQLRSLQQVADLGGVCSLRFEFNWRVLPDELARHVLIRSNDENLDVVRAWAEVQEGRKPRYVPGVATNTPVLVLQGEVPNRTLTVELQPGLASALGGEALLSPVKHSVTVKPTFSVNPPSWVVAP